MTIVRGARQETGAQKSIGSLSSNESIIKDDRVTTYRQFGNKYGKFNLDRVFLLVFANIYVGVQMVDIKFQTVNLYI